MFKLKQKMVLYIVLLGTVIFQIVFVFDFYTIFK